MWRIRGTDRAGSSDGVPPWTLLEHKARYEFAAGLIDGGVVVDCACGDGAGTADYLRGRPEALLGFDVDPEAVAAARLQVADPTASFAVGEASALPQADQSVDLYISLETIEHVPDAPAALREAVRVLRPTGRFICSTPNRNVQNPGSAPTDQPICSSHVREYTPREFLDLLQPFFGAIEFYGQNEVGLVRRQYLRAIRRLPSHRLAARLSQVVKLSRLIGDGLERHAVAPVAAGRMYDFTVAVCSAPRWEAERPR